MKTLALGSGQTNRLEEKLHPIGRFLTSIFLLVALTSTAVPAKTPQDHKPAFPEVTALEPELEALYRDLHEHPELVTAEVKMRMDLLNGQPADAH